jgi:hypothetical protein
MHCLPAHAPHQINNGATCLLYNTVGRMAGVGPSTLLLDVCCGTGTIGITLAKQVCDFLFNTVYVLQRIPRVGGRTLQLRICVTMRTPWGGGACA